MKLIIINISKQNYQ